MPRRGDVRRNASSEAWQSWYKTARWRRLRAKQLATHPYCQCPHHEGQFVPATVVDHRTPHRGNAKLFWDPANLQSMTKDCHDRWKQSQERNGSGFLSGCDTKGWPLSTEHEWYAGD